MATVTPPNDAIPAAAYQDALTLVGNEVVYEFDASATSESRQPPFINLQQFYLEWFMVDRIAELKRTDLRWKNKVIGYTPLDDGARIEVETPAGRYAMEADWVCDCTGVNSFVRDSMGLDTHQLRGIDRWCISDVRFKEKLPIERWTWIEAPFNDNRAVWQHLMADDVWRIDYQMPEDADPDTISRPEVAGARLRAQLGPDVDFEFVWIGPYQYRDHLLDDFRHGRVLFVGDAAHQVSPFGARGANSGIQDTDNLAWKLKLVLDGKAPEALLDTYSEERVAAADENLLNSTRSTDFITPKSQASRDLRNAVLTLAREHAFARALVNSGRLSVPAHLTASTLNTPDVDAFAGVMQPGAPMADAPVRHQGRDGWLLAHTGQRFVLMLFVRDPKDLDATTLAALRALADADIPVHTLLVTERDPADKPMHLLVTLADIHERHEAQERQRMSLNLFQHLHEGLLVTDAEMRTLDVNPAYGGILGTTRETMLGRVPSLLKPDPTDPQAREQRAAMWAALREHGRWRGELQEKRADGLPVPALTYGELKYAVLCWANFGAPGNVAFNGASAGGSDLGLARANGAENFKLAQLRDFIRAPIGAGELDDLFRRVVRAMAQTPLVQLVAALNLELKVCWTMDTDYLRMHQKATLAHTIEKLGGHYVPGEKKAVEPEWAKAQGKLSDVRAFCLARVDRWHQEQKVPADLLKVWKAALKAVTS